MLTPVDPQVHQFTMVGMSNPDENGMMKADGRCLICGTLLTLVTDLVADKRHVFAASEHCR